MNKPTRIGKLIKQLEEIRKHHGDIEVWVKLRDPNNPDLVLYGERLTQIRVEPIPPGEPICAIHAEAA